MNLIRSQVAGLHTFSPAEVAEMFVAPTKPDLVASPTAPQDYLIRPIDVEGPENMGLRQILRYTNRELRTITTPGHPHLRRRSNMSVVEHTWGLAAQDLVGTPNIRMQFSRHDELIPKGYSLVSKVKIMRGLADIEYAPYELQIAVNKAVRGYTRSRANGERPQI